jgi:hypothetical protein
MSRERRDHRRDPTGAFEHADVRRAGQVRQLRGWQLGGQVTEDAAAEPPEHLHGVFQAGAVGVAD